MISIRILAAACVVCSGFNSFAANYLAPEDLDRSVPVTGDSILKTEQALTLSAPSFITEDNIWMTPEHYIEVLLPHPNSDGLDPTGTVNFRYVIRIMKGCDELFMAIVDQANYPYLYRTRFPLFETDYQVQVARQTKTFKRDTSQGTVLVGPPSANPAISDNFRAIDRWLLHIPRKAGGFTGQIAFNNLFPTLPSVVWVAGFDAAGNLVPGSRVPVQVLGVRPVVSIYGSVTSGAAIFPTSLEDQISHIGLYEENSRRFIKAAVTYQNVADDSLTATLAEQSFQTGDTVGSAFVMEARKSTAYWDGVAITNLTSPVDTQVDVVLRSLTDGQEVARSTLGSIVPGQKRLFVLSDLVPFTDNAYYTLEKQGQGGSFQVLGLRGSTVQEPALLVGSEVSKVN